MLWRMIKHATGTDLLSMTLQAMDNHVSSGSLQVPAGDAAWVLEFFCLPPDSKFDRNEFTVHDNSVFHEFYYSDGDVVKRMNGYMEKCGYQIFRDDL